MHLALVRNKEEFEVWKKGYIYKGDIADDPIEYPCWARTVVTYWDHQGEEAVYLYRSDLERMLEAMKS